MLYFINPIATDSKEAFAWSEGFSDDVGYFVALQMPYSLDWIANPDQRTLSKAN